ncbi:MAG: DUF4111 domain-containing protein [Oscillospiraceae bacterium]|jgi:streptomycin 3"-adenylyltransferase|nr:DUF4111 domain-containing protein [Oscillospiraceae bacterium]
MDTLSPAVKAQIDRVFDIWNTHLGSLLTGLYVHGSIALGAFDERSSDIDLLAVCDRKIPRAERLAIAKDILSADNHPSPLEMSAVYADDLCPWRHPMPCQFHYSGMWTKSYQKLLSGSVTKHFLIDEDFLDPDIACHVRLIKLHGIALHGTTDLLPEVPEQDFWHSLTYDIADSDLPSLGRVLSYKMEKRILSKPESAEWLRQFLLQRIRED